jgi:hypothetical protein
MTSTFDVIRFLILLVCALSGNAIWYYIKNILSENGYKISWFRGHFGDLIDFSHLIDKTSDPTTRKNYKLLLRGLIVMLVLFIGTVLSFMADI